MYRLDTVIGYFSINARENIVLKTLHSIRENREFMLQNRYVPVKRSEDLVALLRRLFEIIRESWKVKLGKNIFDIENRSVDFRNLLRVINFPSKFRFLSFERIQARLDTFL